ncbi:anthranilate phosphoribosyltransferase [Parashewanella curva]|uniref:Anthranilate phosphoribosyltransferase n=1 Tax=Parashewanella curva TaxID=2338552 RepID=A0A3L8Q0E3_9GAMM|nr:anthranilate phosphoribosyltransferase [Parashewanella curva]RLV61104.1 anthranilate phosphoribosyltransferase [Parashewanella curva]
MNDNQALFQKVFNGHSLTREQMKCVFDDIITNQVDDIQLASLLTAMKVRGETVEEICGAADASLSHAKEFNRSNVANIVDIVGTGGDGFNTINISTTAAFVAAAAGANVAKHGNKGVSSKSGSSDVLSQLGVDVTVSPEVASQLLEKTGISFLFAPTYHSGFKHAATVRKELKTRTIFNLLGPLVNPARPDAILLGVYDELLVEPIATVLLNLGVKRAMVVHGCGLDEVAVHGETLVCELKDRQLSTSLLTPNSLGVDKYQVKELQGGTPAENAQISRQILSGQGKPAHIAAVAANAGCAIYLSGLVNSPKEGVRCALHILNTDTGYKKLALLIAGLEK